MGVADGAPELREILGQAIVQAEEIHVGVDVQPLGRRQTVVPREQIVKGPFLDGAAPLQGAQGWAHPLGGRDQRPEQLLRPPQIGEIAGVHPATSRPEADPPGAAITAPLPGRAPDIASFCRALAFRHSSSSVSNGGIRSSHSMRDETGPNSRTASRYSAQTSSMMAWSCVSSR